MATSARYTADGLYDLIKNNCDIQNPNYRREGYLEIYLALSGLTCEIYMKSIIYNSDATIQKKLKEHELDDLYRRLPESIRGNLQEKIPGIENKLSEVADIFTALRYDFEMNRFNKNYLVVFDLMEEIRCIAHSYPLTCRPTIRRLGNEAFIY